MTERHRHPGHNVLAAEKKELFITVQMTLPKNYSEQKKTKQNFDTNATDICEVFLTL